MNATPRLVTFEGGPKHRQWLTWADFEAHRATARYMLELVPATPRAALSALDYHDTGRTTTRHIGKKSRGANNVETIATATIWEYQPGDHHA